MPENHNTKQRNQLITELQANLAHAYQVINQQQEYINELEEQLSNNTQKSLDTNISSTLSNKSNCQSSKTKTRYQVRKRVLPSQKKTGKLSQLQFTSIVAIVVAFITYIGFTTMRQPSSQSKQATNKVVNPSKSTTSFPSAPALPTFPQSTSTPVNVSPVALGNLELTTSVYNVQTPPNLRKSKSLQLIVDDVVDLAVATGLPKKPLSVTLINVKNGEYAEYQQKIPRFPASVIKMFWMVYLYGQIQNGRANEADFFPYIDSMIKKSDNNSASVIIDAVTQTQSSTKNLKEEEYKDWIKRRKQLNIFFQGAGYEKIDISQKTYPITDQKIYEPQGADLRMRGNNPKDPIRNKITTQQAARLLYEIYDFKAISSAYSERMANLLSIDAPTRIEKRKQQDPNVFNPVRGYFSESLPTDVYIGSKAGWTSGSRQEAAYIATKNGATYILVVFAEDRAYAYDWKIFPKMSELVFKRMTNTN